MQSFDKIIIVGDSFCRHRNRPSDWPVKLAKLLRCDLQGVGHGGTSWWASRNALLNEQVHDKSITIRIIVHTETVRLHNDHNLPVNTGLLFSEAGGQDDELQSHRELRELAKAFYTSNLFSERFYTWAQQAWIKELDEDTGYYATIHIPAFDSVDLSIVKNGIAAVPSQEFRSLRALSDHEIGQTGWVGRDIRSNHLSDANNINLASALASIILKLQPGDSGERNFDNLDKWEFNQSTDIKSDKYSFKGFF